MSRSTFRLSAVVTTGALVAAALLAPTLPAAAEDLPTPAPTVSLDPAPESSSAPDPEPTAAPEPTTDPDPAPSQPIPEPSPTEAPAVPDPEPLPEDPEAPAEGTVTYAGAVQQLSDEDGIAIDPDIVIFSVERLGFLQVDLSGLATKPEPGSTVALSLAVPAGLDLASDGEAAFTQLANASVVSPLTAVATARIKQTATETSTQSSLINQTPAVSATHHIYAVYVSPAERKVKSPSQSTTTAAQNLVGYANSFWAAQSSGGASINFVLDGVVPWYQSTYSCKTSAGNTALWNQAMAKAKTAGFVPGKNNHLVLFFPDGYLGAGNANNFRYCGGSIGLGTVGGSINQGGLVWVMGDGTDGTTDIDMAKETLVHELGHNMSLGHADWLACPGDDPWVTSVDPFSSLPHCYLMEYGDTADVMGFGVGDGVAGSLSSPQAIRAGIWPSSAWMTQPVGTSGNIVLQPVGGNSGLRAAVLQDYDGTILFVEYRNLQGGDSTNYIGCDDGFANPDAQVCTVNGPHVRILRFEPTGYHGYKGADTYLIGRNYNSVGFTSPETYETPSGSQVQIVAVGPNTATIKLKRVGAISLKTDWVALQRSLSYDAVVRVDDTLSLMLGDWWNVDPTTYTWYRDGSVISGQTGASYTLTPADRGHVINASATINGTPRFDNCALYEGKPRLGCDGRTTPYNTATKGYLVSAGVYQPSQPGSVSIDSTTTPLTVTEADWPVDTTFSYQWLRGATASTATTAATGAGAASEHYTPNAADWNQHLRVKVTATVPGYLPVVRYTEARNLSILTTVPTPASFVISGTPQLGTEVTASHADLVPTDAASTVLSGVSYDYQWLRNGIPVTDTPSATIDAEDDLDYTLRSLDYNANVTLRVTISKPGYVSRVVSTPAFKPTQKGVITASSPTLTITNSYDVAAPMKVLLTSSLSGVSEPDTVTSTQWFRVNLTTGVSTAIPGATLTAYRPVAADYGYKLRVVTTVKKTNYVDLPVHSLTRDFSLRIDPATPLGFTGVVVKVDNTIGTNYPDFHAEIAPGVFNTVHWDSPGMTQTWQWFRSGVKVSGETDPSMLLTTADFTKQMTYTVVASYPGYLAFTATSPKSVVVAPTNFSHGDAAPITQNGLVLTANASLTADIEPDATSMTYQWFRNGVAIPKATARTYTLVPADYGTTTTVKVTYKKYGYADVTTPGNPGGTTQKYWISASDPVPLFAGHVLVGGELAADPLDYFDENLDTGIPLTIGTEVKVTYQWLRDGVAITTADAKDDGDYTLTPADKGKKISLKITAADGAVPARLLPWTRTSAATQPIGTQEIPGADAATVTVAKTAASDEFATTLEATTTNPAGTALKYQWYRDNSAVAGATKATYPLTTADQGKLIWVRVTIAKAPSGTTTFTQVVKDSAKTNYSFTGSTTGPFINLYDSYAVGQVLAPSFVQMQFNGVDVNNPDVRQRWQWLRNGVAIPGATAGGYQLKAADAGTKITVRVTSDLEGGGHVPFVSVWTIATPTATVAKGALAGTSVAPTVVHDGALLRAVPPAVTGSVGPGETPPNATFTYQWLRNNAPISTATKATYALTSADNGKNITVRVVAHLAGYTSVTLPVSVPINYNIKVAPAPDSPYLSSSSWTVGGQANVYFLNFVSDEGAVSGHQIAYQWLRNGVAISGATQPAYTMTAADVNKQLSLRLVVSKPGLLPLTHTVVIPFTLLVQPGVTNSPDIQVVAAGAGTLRVQYDNLQPPAPAPVYTVRWYRADPSTPTVRQLIATAPTYKLTTADANRLISVQVTMARAGFTTPSLVLPGPDAFTDGVNYTVTATEPP